LLYSSTSTGDNDRRRVELDDLLSKYSARNVDSLLDRKNPALDRHPHIHR
jgi:hypothetical protein